MIPTMPRRGIVKSNDLPHLEVLISDTMPTVTSTVGLYASSAILAIAQRFAWVPSSSTNIPARSFHLAQPKVL
jgi:hypothetical protein